MPAGSTVYWAGGVLHAAGANTHSDEWRQSVFVSYALGWLRTVRKQPSCCPSCCRQHRGERRRAQEENQYLDTPSDFAETLDPKLASLLGYRLFSGGGLGLWDPTLGAGPVGPFLGNGLVRRIVRTLARL